MTLRFLSPIGSPSEIWTHSYREIAWFFGARLFGGDPETHKTALKRIKVTYEMSHEALGRVPAEGAWEEAAKTAKT